MAQDIEIVGPRIVFELKNKKPVDLLQFTGSMRAFGDHYRRYAARERPDLPPARLAIGRLDTGSIIAQLVPWLEYVDMLLGHRDFIGPFVAQFGDTMDLIRSFPPRARELPSEDVRTAKKVVEPVASDKGAELNIYAAEGSTIITNVYHIGSNGARDLRRHADIILGGMPNEYDFHGEPMVLHQLRDTYGGAGDYGFIDRFSPAPVKIRWLSAEAKSEVLERSENVFDLVYFVTGTARTAGGSIVSYDIRRLEEVALKPPHDRHG